MPRMRAAKKELEKLLKSSGWSRHIRQIAEGGMPNVGPLFSFLPFDLLIRHRAARALGATVSKIALTDPEAARNVIRRFMWHMNEESGNIGWGIPEAFAETLAASQFLAQTYAGILISYIIDLGHDDNYCDNDILRRSCFWAIGRLAQANATLAEKARPWLIKGFVDKDSICRGMAAWALGQLPASIMDAPALRALAESGNMDECEIFSGEQIKCVAVSELARGALSSSLYRCSR